MYRVMEKREVSENALIDFSAPVNPLGTPKNVVLEIKKSLKNLIHYPDMNATKLREELGKIHNIDPQSIICGNGCTELIHLIPRTMGFKRVLIVQPTFSDYERACKIARPECIAAYYVLDRKNDFDIEPELLVERSIKDDVEAVFMCNPNNPTGRLLPYDGLMEVAQALRKQKVYFVVDESFIDFSSGKSFANAVETNPYTIVLKSLTKFYALAGLRLGYGIFPVHIAKSLREFKEPWTVSPLAQAASIAALNENNYKDRAMKLINGQKKVLEKGFKNLGIEYIPSHANYYLLLTPNAPIIAEQLEGKGILVKGCSNFKGLDRRYLRVSVKSPRENKIFLKCMKEFLA